MDVDGCAARDRHTATRDADDARGRAETTHCARIERASRLARVRTATTATTTTTTTREEIFPVPMAVPMAMTAMKTCAPVLAGASGHGATARYATCGGGRRHGVVTPARSPVQSMGDMEFALLFEDDDGDEKEYYGSDDNEGCSATIEGIKGERVDVESVLIRNLRTLCAPRGEDATRALLALREACRGISSGDARAFKDDSRAEHVRQSGLEKLECALRDNYPTQFAHVHRSKTSCATRGAESLRKLTHHYLWLPPRAASLDSLTAMYEGRYRSMDERVIIEPNLRSHFVVGRATETYKRFVEAVPECFVGSHEQLGEIVRFMCAHMTASFTQVGLDIPPWRQPSALTSKWASPTLNSATSSASSSPSTPFSFNKNSFVDAFMAKAH